MGAMTDRAVVFLATLIPIFAGCSAPMQYGGSERALSLYHDRPKPPHSAPGRGENSSRRAMANHSVPSVLTVDDAIRIAKENSSELAALDAQSEAAEAGVAAADRYRNPELRVSQLRLDQVLDGKPQVRTAIRISPDRLGKVAADVAEARAEQSQAEATRRAAELAIEADIRWLFDEVALLDAEIAAAKTIAQTRRNLAKQMKVRLAASEVTSIDDAMAELSAVESESDLGIQEARRNDVLGELFDKMGVAKNASVQIVGDPPLTWPPAPLASEQSLIEEALRKNPQVMIAAARIDAAEARAFAERSKRFPWFSFIELGYESAPNIAAGQGWTFQAGLDLPIFDTNRSGVAASDAARKAAERMLAAEVDRVVRDVRARIREVQSAEALVTDYRSRALPAAEQAANEAARALEGRNIDTIRALTVDERRVLVQMRLLRLVRRYRSAIAELRRVSGNVNSAVTP